MTALTPTELTTLIAELRRISTRQRVERWMIEEDVEAIARAADALESLSATTPTELNPANLVLYSEAAWAVVRHSSTGSHDKWFPDRGSHAEHALTSAELANWVDDWQIMRPAGPWIPTETETP